MKTYFFVRNVSYRPSTYYRLYQYLIGLQNSEEIIINEYESNIFYKIKSKNFIIQKFNKIIFGLILGHFNRVILIVKLLNKSNYNVFIQREIFPRFIDPLSKVLIKKVIKRANAVYWDFDDNIFDAKEISNFEKKILCEFSTKIFAGNNYLKNLIDPTYHSKIQIVNTTDKMMETFKLEDKNEKRLAKYHSEVTLVWVGTKINIKYLEKIISRLDQAAMKVKNKKLILKVISNTKVSFDTDQLKIINLEWNRDLAFQEMENAHIGIMPLTEDRLTRGKCAFKAVQFIGCGLPVIVSNVGMNNEVIKYHNGYLINDEEEWVKRVVELSSEKSKWIQKSNSSRKLWEEHFHSKKVEDLILHSIKE